MTNTENATRMYGTEFLHTFQKWYAVYHGYVAIIVCVFGVVTSVFNIIVLTRKNMRNTTNYILTALAVSDMLTMASYIPFAMQFYVLHGLKASPERNVLPWIHFFYFHVNFVVTTHTVSIWLGVILSIFRYAYVQMAHKGARCGPKQTFLAITCVFVLSVIILIPNYLSLKIVSGEHSNQTIYDITSIDTDDTYGIVVTSVNFWIHAILIKLVPCVMLTIFGILLILTLRSSQKRRKNLQRPAQPSNSSANALLQDKNSNTTSNDAMKPIKPKKNKLLRSRDRDHSRTTAMLIVVIVLFLITELPQGILALFSGLMPGFFEAFYMPLGDLMDIIALINNAINFILYCSMSKQFRDTFLGLFCWPFLPPEKRIFFNGTTYADYTLHAAARNMFFTEEKRELVSLPVKSRSKVGDKHQEECLVQSV